MLREMFLLLAGSVSIFATLNPRAFALLCVGGLVLGAALWWLCSLVANLWNRSYSLLWYHHVLCALAAGWTLLFCIAFASVAELGHCIDQIVTAWDLQMPALEGGVIASRFQNQPIDGLLSQFRANHPFLRYLLQQDATTSLVAAHTPLSSNASLARTIDQVSYALKSSLFDHLRWTIERLRLCLLSSFLLAQTLVFVITSYAAQRDIRPHF